MSNANLSGGDYTNGGASAAGAADNAVLYTSLDVSKYNYHVIENESGATVDVFVSVDGTNYSTAAASVVLVDDVTTGGGIAVIDIADNKIGILRGKYRKVRVIQKGAGTAVAAGVRVAHAVE
jgi:hypothetical protein